MQTGFESQQIQKRSCGRKTTTKQKARQGEVLTASKQELVVVHGFCREEQGVVGVKRWLQLVPLRRPKKTAEEY